MRYSLHGGRELFFDKGGTCVRVIDPTGRLTKVSLQGFRPAYTVREDGMTQDDVLPQVQGGGTYEHQQDAPRLMLVLVHQQSKMRRSEGFIERISDDSRDTIPPQPRTGPPPPRVSEIVPRGDAAGQPSLDDELETGSG